MDPIDFYNLAVELSANAKPAHCRSAISRAYYAAYHVAVGLVKAGSNTISEGAKGHGEITKFLGNSGDAKIASVGSKLGDLQGKRTKADYKLADISIELQKDAEIQVNLAKQLIDEIDKCSKDPNRLRVTSEGIRKFKIENKYIF